MWRAFVVCLWKPSGDERGVPMSNFWIRETGQNTLSGVEGDFYNRPVLPDYLIIEFLSDGNQKARDDFQALLPSMLPEEQERLNHLYAFSTPPRDHQQLIEDKFQGSMNKLKVNTSQRLPNQSTNQSLNVRSGLKVRL
jgi:hypothetical protein